jgi:hypothetical protein
MKVAFLHNAHLRERKLADALSIGLRCHGDRLLDVTYDDDARDLDCDAIAVIGVKCREWVEHCRATGQRFIYFDKGYYYPKEKSAAGRIVNCWRASVDTTQPIEFLATAKCDEGRWRRFNVWPRPWREPTADGHIIIAGSSPKYHLFNQLPAPTDYYQAIVNEIRKHTDRPIHYRPKPSWREAVPLEGAEFIPSEPFDVRANGAHAIVTHGSNASLIGMLNGIPSIIVGNGVMRPISSTELGAIERPYLATEEEKRQLLSNLAYSQWTLRELQNGQAWHHLKTTFLQ